MAAATGFVTLIGVTLIGATLVGATLIGVAVFLLATTATFDFDGGAATLAFADAAGFFFAVTTFLAVTLVFLAFGLDAFDFDAFAFTDAFDFAMICLRSVMSIPA